MKLSNKILLSLTILISMAITLLACSWDSTERSIRFADGTLKRYYLLPPLPRTAGSEAQTKEQQGLDHLNNIDLLWKRALLAEESGDLKTTAELLELYLKDTYSQSRAYNNQAKRNSAIDKLDALTALNQGSTIAAVKTYLKARSAFDQLYNPDPEKVNNISSVKIPSNEEIEQTLNSIQSDDNLQDNIEYLKSIMLYHQREFEKSNRGFNRLIANYPDSEKREAAIFMTARVNMEQGETEYSADSTNENKGVEIKQNRYWRASLAGFKKVVREYPKGRYTGDAHGWIGYLLLESGEKSAALLEYYRMMASEHFPYVCYDKAFKSVKWIRDDIKDDDISQIEARLLKEPEAGLAYAYYEIYYSQAFNSYHDYETDSNQSPDRSLAHFAIFVSQLLKLHPKLTVTSSFLVRAAMVSLELDQNQQAIEFSQRALKMGISGEERARAMFVKGIAEHRSKDFTNAKASLTELINEDVSPLTTEYARKNLALVDEALGDLEGALAQYLQLGFHLDVAYLIDVLMTTDQLAHYIAEHQSILRRDELIYALGLRYLREGRLTEARATFLQVHTLGSDAAHPFESDHSRHSRERLEHPKDDYNGREYEVDYHKTWNIIGVHQEYLISDLSTVDDLARLQQAVEKAQGDEERANALYNLAYYQFKSCNLLYYNPVAWRGARYVNLDGLQIFHNDAEAQILWKHFQEHQPVAHALEIFLEIVEKYPDSSVAKDSFYNAARAHYVLSNYSSYWKNMYSKGLYAGHRYVTDRDAIQFEREHTYHPKPVPEPLWKRYARKAIEMSRDYFPILSTMLLFIIVLIAWVKIAKSENSLLNKLKYPSLGITSDGRTRLVAIIIIRLATHGAFLSISIILLSSLLHKN